MHTGPMPESAGDFTKTETGMKCRQCQKRNVVCKTWESSDGAYEDYKYTCPDCGAIWWVDGIDS